jgi:hypothetical protein
MADDTKVTRRRRGLSLAVAAATFACVLAAPAGAAVDPRWSLDAMNAPAAWALSTGAGVSVAVVDTGVEAYHPAFGGRVAGGWGFDGTTDDLYGHGTAVAGLIAGSQSGMAPGAGIIPFRAFVDDNPVTDGARVVDALDRAGDSGARVVNASFSSESFRHGLPASFRQVAAVLAAHPGTLYVTAAGNETNDNDDYPTLPCNVEAANLLCVGAYDEDGAPWAESNFGAASVDVFAPGFPINAPDVGGGYTWRFNGTSMAAAFVSGEAALLFARVPRLTPAQAIGLILGSSRGVSAFATKAATSGAPDALAALRTAIADGDGDGVPDMVDDCPADPYPTSDGCAPPPQPTATPHPSVTPSPTPIATPTGDTLPHVKSFTTKVSKCRSGRSCKQTATVKLKPDRTANVSLRVERRTCPRGRCRWTRVLTKAFSAGTRGAQVIVRGKQRTSLPKGSYRAVAVLSSSAGAAKPVTRRFQVR